MRVRKLTRFISALLLAATVTLILSGGVGALDDRGSTPVFASFDGQDPDLDWVRQEIVGTWSQEPGKQDRTWVFTADGMLKKYQDGTLIATKDYAIVSQCKDYEIEPGKFEPMAILKETSENGQVACNSVKNLKKTEEGPGDPPFLLVGTRYGVFSFDSYESPSQ